MFFTELATKSSSGSVASCHSRVYVSSSVQALYLSYKSLLNLGLLSHSFPSLSEAGDTSAENDIRPGPEHSRYTPPAENVMWAANDACHTPNTTHNSTCSCPQGQSCQTSPLTASIPLYARKQWMYEAMAPRQICCLYIQHLPTAGLTMHGGTTDRDTCWLCHTPANVLFTRYSQQRPGQSQDS